jgi:hypothetical protein
MGFSGARAIVLIAVLVVLMVAVSKFDLPGWIVPIGLLVSAGILKNKEKAASDSSEVSN